MQTIHKFYVPDESPFSLELPKDAVFLDVQFQKFTSASEGPNLVYPVDKIVMWFMLDVDMPKWQWVFASVITGYKMTHFWCETYKYLKTVQNPSGLILHIFQDRLIYNTEETAEKEIKEETDDDVLDRR